MTEEGEANHIKISFLLAGESRIVHEVKTDIFLKTVHVVHMSASDKYLLMMGPIEIEMPCGIGKEMVEDMLMMLEREDQVGILKVAEEKM